MPVQGNAVGDGLTDFHGDGEPSVRGLECACLGCCKERLGFMAECLKDGASHGTRTHDLLITNELLYQLS